MKKGLIGLIDQASGEALTKAKLIGDDAPNHYYIKIDDKYFQVSAVTSAHQAARNLVPTVSYSGEGTVTFCCGVILFVCVHVCLHIGQMHVTILCYLCESCSKAQTEHARTCKRLYNDNVRSFPTYVPRF